MGGGCEDWGRGGGKFLAFVQVVFVLLARLAAAGCRVDFVHEAATAAAGVGAVAGVGAGVLLVGVAAAPHGVLDEVHVQVVWLGLEIGSLVVCWGSGDVESGMV